MVARNNRIMMKAIDDRIGFRGFLARIFISQSGVSSRRVGGFISLIATLFLVFFQFPIEYCKIMMYLVVGFFALTTISSFGQQKPDEDNKG